MELANAIERRLKRGGWEVMRPEREAPNLSWDEYLQWVQSQAKRGISVIEIHGMTDRNL